MFSLCIFNRHLTKIKALNYIPVGLGKDNFSNESKDLWDKYKTPNS